MNGLQPILPSTDLDRSTLDNHTNSESLVLQLTRWKGNKASHTAQTASATQSTSPSSNTRSPFNHSERSGKVLWRWTGEEEEEEESYGEVLSFITGEAQCCLEHGQRLKTLWSAYKNVPRTHQFSCPWHSRKEMIDLKWQSEDKMPFIAARVNKTHKKSTVKASAWSYKKRVKHSYLRQSSVFWAVHICQFSPRVSDFYHWELYYIKNFSWLYLKVQLDSEKKGMRGVDMQQRFKPLAAAGSVHGASWCWRFVYWLKKTMCWYAGGWIDFEHSPASRFPVSSFYAKLQAVASQLAFPIYLRPDQKSYSVSCL